MYPILLICIDFSECSLVAARYAFQMSRAMGSRLVLLHLCEMALKPEEARKRLDRLAKEARFAPKIRIEDRETETHLQLKSIAQMERANTILLGARDPQKGSSGRLTQSLIECSPVPVLVFSDNCHPGTWTQLEWLKSVQR
ncbi:MAG: universal stress protein [Deinococcaceae bacterium]